MNIEKEITISEGKYFATININPEKNRETICIGTREEDTHEWFLMDVEKQEAVDFVACMTILLNSVLNELK